MYRDERQRMFFDVDMFVLRRKKLAEDVVRLFNPLSNTGAIFVCASFEEERRRFRQNSYFYYLFGITEPGAVGIIRLDGSAELYLPDFGGGRGLWVDEQVALESDPSLFGLNAIKPLGQVQKGYSSNQVFSQDAYKNLITDLGCCDFIGGVWSDPCCEIVTEKILHFFEGKICQDQKITNCVSVVDSMRRKKSSQELSIIKKAISITELAHHAVAKVLEPGMYEYEVQAVIESEFLRNGSLIQAFPSIVGGGVKSTVLHYVGNDRVLQDGDLVVVDIGAEYSYYASDLTRTYPVNGKYSSRQREIYELVLEAQRYIERCAKPGMFLRNAVEKEKSLQWLTSDFFKQKGLDKYFPHGIGHYMGLDVHDVGSYLEPLQPGDVITIEPGLYLRDEAIGVRIEDNYLVTDSGVECLSISLEKDVSLIETAMQ